jgi:hypothetical protein
MSWRIAASSLSRGKGPRAAEGSWAKIAWRLFPALVAASPDVALAQDDLADLDALTAELSGAAPTSSNEPMTSLREVSGFVAEEVRFYPVDRNQGRNDEQVLTEMQLDLSLQLADGLDADATPWLLLDALDDELRRYEPLEAYLIYRAESWDVTAGQFIESWGIVDTFNPLDVLNRRDLAVDLLEAPARGELGGRFRVTIPSLGAVGEPTVSLYAVPLFRETPLPTLEQRSSLSIAPAELRQDQASTPGGAERVMAALRFDSTLNTEVVSADLQLLGARGPSRMPLFAVQPSPDGTIALVPQYYGEWVLGGGFRAVPEAPFWSKFTLKAEVAYKRPYAFSRFSGPHSADLESRPYRYLQVVGGVDRAFPQVFSQKDELTLTVEYAEEFFGEDAASVFRPFDSDVAVRLHYAFGNFARSSVEVRGVSDVTDGESIVEGVVRSNLRFLHDDLALELSGRWLRAAEGGGSLLSTFPTDNSQLASRLQFDF